jgi:hypothetical protein
LPGESGDVPYAAENIACTSRHLRPSVEGEPRGHIELIAAAGVDVLPDERGDGVEVDAALCEKDEIVSTVPLLDDVTPVVVRRP